MNAKNTAESDRSAIVEPSPASHRWSALVSLLTSLPARVVGTLLCLFAIAWIVDLNTAFAVLSKARVDLLATGFLLTVPAVVAAVLEWGVLLECHQPGCWKQLFMLYLKSLAPAQVMPTGLGGDAVRILGTATTTSWQSATAAVAASRMASTIAIFGWSCIAALREQSTYGPWLVLVTGAATLGMFVFCAVLFISDPLILKGVKLLKVVNAVWARHALSFVQAFRETRNEKGRLLLSLLAAILGWLAQFASLQFLANSTGATVRFDLIPIGFALSMFATAVPFALNGLGIKEGVWIGVLVRAGVSPAHSAAIAVLADLQMVPLACLSALLWIRRQRPLEDGTHPEQRAD